MKMGKTTLVVAVPKGWIDYNKLRPGDKVEITANGELTIRPLKKSETIEINLPMVKPETESIKARYQT